MGKLIIQYNDGSCQSFKCKTKERGDEIAGKRRNVKGYNFYNDGERIPKSTKKKRQQKELTFEEMERLIQRF